MLLTSAFTASATCWRRQHSLHFHQMQQISRLKLSTLLNSFVMLLVGVITATVAIVVPSIYKASNAGSSRKRSPSQKQAIFIAIQNLHPDFPLRPQTSVFVDQMPLRRPGNFRGCQGYQRQSLDSCKVVDGDVVATGGLVSVVTAGYVSRVRPKDLPGPQRCFRFSGEFSPPVQPFSTKPKLGRQKTIRDMI